MHTLFLEMKDNLMMIKVSSNLPQSKLEGLLLSFVGSNRNILLLVANTDDLTKSMISDLRIMMEEVEGRFVNSSKKLFILLLHFSPIQFFEACYSSLYLQGWDHYYLDSIFNQSLTREGNVRVMVDVQYWYEQCCFPIEPNFPDPMSQMKPVLIFLLREAIPVLCSRVTGLSKTLDISGKSKLLKKFLLDEEDGEQEPTIPFHIGEMMCGRFSSYWTKKVIADCMQEVVTATYNKESTLNIKESIQTVFRSLFIDFLVYMISKLSVDGDMDTLFNKLSNCKAGPLCLQSLLAVFRGVFETVSLPQLAQLSALSSSHLPHKSGSRHRFPFFQKVCEAMDDTLEESKARIKLLPTSGNVEVNKETELFRKMVVKLNNKVRTYISIIFVHT